MHQVVEVKRRDVACGTLPLAEKHRFAAALTLGRPRGVQAAGRRELGGRRDIEHVLQLRHMGYLDPWENGEALLHGVDRVAIEVGGPEFEFGEILHRPYTALRAMDLLVEEATQASGIEPHAPLLGPVIRVQMELARGMPIHMAVETGYA